MRKKVLFVIDSLRCGGAEKSLISLFPLLNQEKYEIHLWMLYRGGDFEKLLPSHVKIEESPSYSDFEQIRRKLHMAYYSVLFRFLNIIGKHQHSAETLWKCIGNTYKVPSESYDVAVAYQQGLPTYIVAQKIKTKKRIAWINADIFSAGYDVDFNASFYDKMDAIVPVSQELEVILNAKYPQYSNKYYCIYDILNPTMIKRQSLMSVGDMHGEGERKILVTTARLSAVKNHKLAIEAAKILKERGFDFVWLFIGEGEERQHIEEFIQKYDLHEEVRLLGVRTNPYPYMASCDVYVQTSIFEGYGLTVAEAKILERPVVSTNFDVVYGQIVHGENGLIAEMTAESVADNIIRLLEEPNLRNHIIANLRKEKNTTYITEEEKVERLLDDN